MISLYHKGNLRKARADGNRPERMEKMKAKSINEAWGLVNEIFETDYIKDEQASQNAGYPVYWTTAAGKNAWISDLGDRLEVNQNGKSINIWIVDEQEPETAEEFRKEKVVRAELTTEHATTAETVTKTVKAEVRLSAEVSFSEIVRFQDEVKKLYSEAIKAIKADNYLDIEITVHTYKYFPNRNWKTLETLETVGFDRWTAAPVWEQDTDGVYFRPDTRYTSEYKDGYLTKKTLFSDLAAMIG